ncbi:MAG: LytR family transcriptional regulator [Actinobacteria bacterium]|nr:MAG: LytR family transcriptional regulator [Actinomycetota bacterium]
MGKHVKKSDAEDGDRRAKILKRLKILGLTLLILVLVGTVAALAVFAYIGNKITPEDKEIGEIRQEVAARKPLEPQNILLLGSDTRGEKRARSDTIIIAHIDTVHRRAILLSIPRDTRVDIPGYGKDKINASTFYGGPSLTIKTVKELTGLPIHHFVEVDFKGFTQLVTAIGGVWINVEKKIDDPRAGSVVLEPGYQRLYGKAALTYVRTRKDAQGDYGRIKRQQKFFAALLDQSNRFQTLFRIPQLVNIFAANTKTDMTLGELAQLAYNMKSIKRKDMEGATLPVYDKMINGGWYAIPKEEEIAAICEKIRRNQQLGSSDVPTDTAGQPGPVLPKDITIEVKNGGGPSGAAAQLGRKLNAAGFVVTAVGNAQRRDYQETQVVYRDNRAKAVKVEQTVGKGALISSRGRYRMTADVLVILGMDY